MFPILITLGEAYYNNGFINIPIACEGLFGIHGTPIKIYLGIWNAPPFFGTINRTANPNGTPRIMMGKTYTLWVQANKVIGGVIIINGNNPLFPNSILIS